MEKSGDIRLRPWSASDKASLIRYGSNPRRWVNMTDRFPNPYTQADADTWIEKCAVQPGPPTNFAIELGVEAIGGVGFEILGDVNRKTAEIGYWLGEPFWGRGIATRALRETTIYAFANFDLERLQAHVYEWNPASARVLEKNGYTLEARLRRHVIKDGRIGDALLYARLRAE